MSRLEIHVRPARAQELALLPEIERRAGRRFEEIEALRESPADVTPPEELAAAHERGLVWVAVTGDDGVIGFAYAAMLDGCCHLEELDLLPEHGRRGVGTALVDAVRAHAEGVGLRGVTLTTYRDVPWNAPLYRRLGFQILHPGALTPGLAAAVADEARRGLDPDLRVVMALRF